MSDRLQRPGDAFLTRLRQRVSEMKAEAAEVTAGLGLPAEDMGIILKSLYGGEPGARTARVDAAPGLSFGRWMSALIEGLDLTGPRQALVVGARGQARDESLDPLTITIEIPLDRPDWVLRAFAYGPSATAWLELRHGHEQVRDWSARLNRLNTGATLEIHADESGWIEWTGLAFLDFLADLAEKRVGIDVEGPPEDQNF